MKIALGEEYLDLAYVRHIGPVRCIYAVTDPVQGLPKDHKFYGKGALEIRAFFTYDFQGKECKHEIVKTEIISEFPSEDDIGEKMNDIVAVLRPLHEQVVSQWLATERAK